MHIPAFAERRLTERRKLTGLLPGRISIQGSKNYLNCRPVDISRHGLGILSSQQLPQGTTLILKLPDKEVILEVSWGQPDFGKHDLFRYGLVTTDHQLDLEEIFAKAGCLK